MALQAAKKALRADLKQKLKNIPVADKVLQSEIVAKKLFKHSNYLGSSRISIYLSRDIEINTEPIVKNIFALGKECFIPKYDSSKPVMEMVKLRSMEDYENLPLTKWNIKQPSIEDDREEAIATGGLDLMIVPGIGFTKEGHRIGNGKGYYDSYISTYAQSFKKPIYTIALAFREQVVSYIPISEHDVAINEIIFADL